jgi:hypothetical protein
MSERKPTNPWLLGRAIFAKQKPIDAQREIHCCCNHLTKGGLYGIPDFTCCHFNDGALRANHRWLFETARMVAIIAIREVINLKTLSTPLSKEEKHAHNEIAAVLSIVPGLGHIYKGHYEMGLFLMFLGMPIAIFVGIISILGTAGLGLLFPIGCWAALAYDAYRKKDRRHHHHLTSEADDESQD